MPSIRQAAPRANALAMQLSTLRVKRGLSIRQVAKITGRSFNTVALADRGVTMGWGLISDLLKLYGAELVVKDLES